MQAAVIDLQAMEPQHLEGALMLSRQAKWPHRLEDWRMLLTLSRGLVLVDVGRVMATIFLTPFGEDVATINMVIVDESLRGRGIGKTLMQQALALAGDRECRLVATTDGLPLYRKLGFVETGEILQLQGPLSTVPLAPPDVTWAQDADRAEILALDRQALGADRRILIDYLATHGRIAVLRRRGELVGYGVIRDFGRGEVVGPVIAGQDEDARSLISFLFSTRQAGSFLRVDTTSGAGLADWLSDHWLVNAGGGIAMIRAGKRSALPSDPTIHRFALASQALG